MIEAGDIYLFTGEDVNDPKFLEIGKVTNVATRDENGNCRILLYWQDEPRSIDKDYNDGFSWNSSFARGESKLDDIISTDPKLIITRLFSLSDMGLI